ncbi:hypothetical protein, partial [Tannerella forsythia]|uniref:hypothetical protein n=1 Tax=Tannerella forsythia TaxID=28112 RepID=UPI000A5BFF72
FTIMALTTTDNAIFTMIYASTSWTIHSFFSAKIMVLYKFNNTLYLNQSLTYDTTLDKYQDVEIMLRKTFSQIGLEEKDYNKSLVFLSETIKRNLNHR